MFRKRTTTELIPTTTDLTPAEQPRVTRRGFLVSALGVGASVLLASCKTNETGPTTSTSNTPDSTPTIPGAGEQTTSTTSESTPQDTDTTTEVGETRTETTPSASETEDGISDIITARLIEIGYSEEQAEEYQRIMRLPYKAFLKEDYPPAVYALLLATDNRETYDKDPLNNPDARFVDYAQAVAIETNGRVNGEVLNQCLPAVMTISKSSAPEDIMLQAAALNDAIYGAAVVATRDRDQLGAADTIPSDLYKKVAALGHYLNDRGDPMVSNKLYRKGIAAAENAENTIGQPGPDETRKIDRHLWYEATTDKQDSEGNFQKIRVLRTDTTITDADGKKKQTATSYVLRSFEGPNGKTVTVPAIYADLAR